MKLLRQDNSCARFIGLERTMKERISAQKYWKEQFVESSGVNIRRERITTALTPDRIMSSLILLPIPAKRLLFCYTPFSSDVATRPSQLIC